MHHWVLVGFIYLAFPGFGRAAPHKALVYDPQILLPVVHFEPVHMGAPGRTHDRKHIRVPLYFSDEIKSRGELSTNCSVLPGNAGAFLNTLAA